MFRSQALVRIAVAVIAWFSGSAASPAQASRVLVLSSGDSTVDTTVIARLQGFGHTATLGPAYTSFDGTQSLANIDVVYFQANSNWAAGDMPAGGQTALVNFVNAGGGLVTSEWVSWKWASQGSFVTLGSVFALNPSGSYDGNTPVTYTAAAADVVLNGGLPNSFAFPVDSFAGTETLLVAGPTGTVYYNASTNAGVVGRGVGAGRVLHLSTTMGVSSLNDPNMGRLFSNAINWAHQGCAGDFDGNGQVQPADVSLFVNTWFASVTGGTLAGDFDHNGQVQPADVSLFVNTWFASVVAGC